MKIRDAKAAYSSHVQTLWEKKRALTQALKDQEKSGVPTIDRVELSKELKKVDAEYDEAKKSIESIMLMESTIHNGEVARQQAKAMDKMAKTMAKALEIYRRIASGGRVPPEDENALMNYSKELYMAAKAAALLQKDKDKKEYDSVLEDEEEDNDSTDAAETAANTEISIAMPESAGDASASAV